MKKVLIMALAVVAMTTSAFASGKNEVSRSVKNQFEMEFIHASNVEWSQNEKFAQASFIEDAKMTHAFYDLSGNFVGKSKAVSIDNLPVAAKRNFAKKFAGFAVTESIVFESKDETAYFISGTKDGKSVILKVSEIGAISQFNK